ncbi:hypothetical protein GO988_06950 [Hymenobacter sp. HMF4947]|uniref:Uncharacterized protein n=1 Tax=Hymenobacter ginkgonis TaxID=2682976 RepID=A0A7K1TCD0_9BACT|nr:hypothetical protein [Hymenobacter ginkgonis]MVN76058.1 hypothetical protein [Hymenobacter ginkgonis]
MKDAIQDCCQPRTQLQENMQFPEDILLLEETTHMSFGAIRAALIGMSFTVLMIVALVRFFYHSAEPQPAAVSYEVHAAQPASTLASNAPQATVQGVAN